MATKPLFQIFDNFNSLAPCGANLDKLCQSSPMTSFQLTRPVRGEPFSFSVLVFLLFISTHSPRAGRTNDGFVNGVNSGNFNSLAPCGANLSSYVILFPCVLFQLTRPVRGEPLVLWACKNRLGISTHSPRAGRTYTHCKTFILTANFNSLAPCGANRNGFEVVYIDGTISTHSPRAGRTDALSQIWSMP